MVKEFFLKVKPSTILLLLKDTQQSWYPSKLARSSNSSYVHTVNFLRQLRKANIVTMEKKGRQAQYKLTEKGMQLALSLDDFIRKCEFALAEAEKPSSQPAPTQVTQLQEKKQ
ncbi:MAG: winged helix-turn-helix domain-containing protein [Candidatus Anstonellaceae archaeon]